MFMIKFTIRRMITVILIAVAMLAVWYWQFGRKAQPTYDTVIAERSLVFQELSVTGRVKPVEEVNLAFERGGMAAKVNIKIGDAVTVGQPLIELNTIELKTDLNKAEAARQSAYANRAQYWA